MSRRSPGEAERISVVVVLDVGRETRSLQAFDERGSRRGSGGTYDAGLQFLSRKIVSDEVRVENARERLGLELHASGQTGRWNARNDGRSTDQRLLGWMRGRYGRVERVAHNASREERFDELAQLVAILEALAAEEPDMEGHERFLRVRTHPELNVLLGTRQRVEEEQGILGLRGNGCLDPPLEAEGLKALHDGPIGLIQPVREELEERAKGAEMVYGHVYTVGWARHAGDTHEEPRWGKGLLIEHKKNGILSISLAKNRVFGYTQPAVFWHLIFVHPSNRVHLLLGFSPGHGCAGETSKRRIHTLWLQSLPSQTCSKRACTSVIRRLSGIHA